jgi:hypothetical protein
MQGRDFSLHRKEEVHAPPYAGEATTAENTKDASRQASLVLTWGMGGNMFV